MYIRIMTDCHTLLLCSNFTVFSVSIVIMLGYVCCVCYDMFVSLCHILKIDEVSEDDEMEVFHQSPYSDIVNLIKYLQNNLNTCLNVKPK